MYIRYKVVDKDITSVIGVVCEDNGDWKFLQKEWFNNFIFENALIDKRGAIHLYNSFLTECRKRDVFTRRDGRIITYAEFEEIKKFKPKNFEDFKKVRNTLR